MRRPEDVFISTDDTDSYRLCPEHRWIYNKLLVAESQGIACAPHGIMPESFPVFSKPIYNLRGMGMETRVFETAEEYLAERDPGHMWSELLTGEHLSTDMAVVGGTIRPPLTACAATTAGILTRPRVYAPQSPYGTLVSKWSLSDQLTDLVFRHDDRSRPRVPTHLPVGKLQDHWNSEKRKSRPPVFDSDRSNFRDAEVGDC